MNDLYVFSQDREKYINQMQIEQNEFTKQKLTRDFKDKTKRYLGVALGIISSTFEIEYSINEQAVGMTSSYQKINSLVRKTDEAIFGELLEFESKLKNLNIPENEKNKAKNAIEIVRIYCSEDPYKSMSKSKIGTIAGENDAVYGKLLESQSTLPEEEDKKDKSKKLKPERQKFYIIYKVILGTITIPVLCFLATLAVIFFIDSFSTTDTFVEMMENNFYKTIFPYTSYVLIILISGLLSIFVSGLIEFKSENKLSFSILSFSILTFLSTYIIEIVGYISNLIGEIPPFVKVFEYSYFLVSLYSLMLFFYLFNLFDKNKKVKSVEIVNIIIIAYTSLLPGIAYILNVFQFNYLHKLIRPFYGGDSYMQISRGLLLISITINVFYTIFKTVVVNRTIRKNNIFNYKEM